VVERVLREFLKCGLLQHGFALLWCGECRRSVLVGFSCRGRSFCPSCEKERQLLWAECLGKEVLAPVSHRHVVLTIPRLLRPLFRRRRELLTELGRAAAEATAELVRRGLGHDARPGLVVSIATAGDLAQWHPHLHPLTTDVTVHGRSEPAGTETCYISRCDEMSALARSVDTHKALAHPVRQRLVAMLREGELCVCQMTTVLELAASTVSAHLADLKRAELFVESKKGRFVSYGWSPDPATAAQLRDVVARIAKDPQVAADARLVRSLRRVDVEELCRVELDLSRVGIRRPAVAVPGPRR
jgi:arsenate reductase/ArsR family transcriptional regulator